MVAAPSQKSVDKKIAKQCQCRQEIVGELTKTCWREGASQPSFRRGIRNSPRRPFDPSKHSKLYEFRAPRALQNRRSLDAHRLDSEYLFVDQVAKHVLFGGISPECNCSSS